MESSESGAKLRGRVVDMPAFLMADEACKVGEVSPARPSPRVADMVTTEAICDTNR